MFIHLFKYHFRQFPDMPSFFIRNIHENTNKNSKMNITTIIIAQFLDMFLFYIVSIYLVKSDRTTVTNF